MLKKIPKFDEVKEWAIEQGWVTSQEAQDAAPVQSVNGSTGDVEVEQVNDFEQIQGRDMSLLENRDYALLENTPTDTLDYSDTGGYTRIQGRTTDVVASGQDGAVVVDIAGEWDGIRWELGTGQNISPNTVYITDNAGNKIYEDTNPDIGSEYTINFDLREFGDLVFEFTNNHSSDQGAAIEYTDGNSPPVALHSHPL